MITLYLTPIIRLGNNNKSITLSCKRRAIQFITFLFQGKITVLLAKFGFKILCFIDKLLLILNLAATDSVFYHFKVINLPLKLLTGPINQRLSSPIHAVYGTSTFPLFIKS